VPITVTVRTDADPATTWQRISDIPNWPDWNPACAAVITDDATIGPGTRLRMQMRHPRGRLFWTEPEITALNAPEELSWMIRAMGVRAPLTIRCDELTDGGTAVTLTTRSSGFMAFAYRLVFPEKTQGLLWSGTLTALGQSLRPAEPAPTRSESSRRPR